MNWATLTTDFVGNTANYDLMTVDIVWSGEYTANGYTLPLNDFVERDKAELQMDDIMPVAWSLGEWEGKQWAYTYLPCCGGGAAGQLDCRVEPGRQSGNTDCFSGNSPVHGCRRYCRLTLFGSGR
ncbi:MAG: hypothetical protein L6R45_28655 [Anaerolineae bacterium]|nr:hypothetical protein [Anaerolineae bacterium]